MRNDTMIRPDCWSYARNCELIQDTAFEAIRAGLNPEDSLEWVLLHHKQAHTTRGCIYWYRAELRRRGEYVPDADEGRTVRRAA